MKNPTSIFFAYLDAFHAGIPQKKITGPLGADFLWARGLVDLAIFRGRGPKIDVAYYSRSNGSLRLA